MVEQHLQLNQEEIQYLKTLYKIEKRIGECNNQLRKWANGLYEDKEMPKDMPAKWARVVNLKRRLRIHMNNYFSPNEVEEIDKLKPGEL